MFKEFNKQLAHIAGNKEWSYQFGLSSEFATGATIVNIKIGETSKTIAVIPQLKLTLAVISEDGVFDVNKGFYGISQHGALLNAINSVTWN